MAHDESNRPESDPRGGSHRILLREINSAQNSRTRLNGVIDTVMKAVEKLKLPPPFDDAVRSMEREIMRYLVRSTGNRDDAMDLFQETWLRAYRAYPALQSEDGLRPWIFRIASNLCRNRVRDKTRRRRAISDELADADAFAEVAPFNARGSPDGVLHLK